MAFGSLTLRDVTNARVSDGRLAVERQANRLHRLDRKRLMRFDQRTVMREVVDADRVTRIEGAPERTEHFEPDPSATVAGCSRHPR
jgi:hypothetical protein